MSILIKGVEMPITCQICRTARLDRLIDCEEFDRLSIAQRMYKRSDTCPLIEVPTPHGRLIDADKLYKWIKAECNPYGKPTIGKEDGMRVIEIIEACHTVIEAEEGEG